MFKIIYYCIVGITCIPTIYCVIAGTNCSNLVLNYYFGGKPPNGQVLPGELTMLPKPRRPPIETLSRRMAKHPSVPSGYKLYQYSYYKYYKNAKNFANAVWECVGDNAHLAVLNSRDEAKYLGKLMNKEEGNTYRGRRKRKWAHIGFHDYFKTGKYITILGQSLYKTGYVDWAPGRRHHHCGSMNRDGLIDDIDCSVIAPFICEIEVTPNCSNYDYSPHRKRLDKVPLEVDTLLN